MKNSDIGGEFYDTSSLTVNIFMSINFLAA